MDYNKQLYFFPPCMVLFHVIPMIAENPILSERWCRHMLHQEVHRCGGMEPYMKMNEQSEQFVTMLSGVK